MTFWFSFRKFANRHQILERSSSTSTIYWCNLLRWLLNWCHLSTGSWMESLRALITMVWFISLDARVANTLSGLELARLADFPPDVLIEGRRVAAKLADSEKRGEEHSQTSKIAIRRKALLRVKLEHLTDSTAVSKCWTLPFQLRTQLTQILEHSQLPEKELLEYLARFQRDITKVLRETL